PTSPGGGVGGSAPATAARVLTYSVTFPAAGTYDLYARIRVGANGPNDDSFFYANGFGSKSPTTGTDWTQANNLYNIGYTASADIVAGAGSAATGVWKWLNISQYSFGSAALVTFTVPAGALTQTFQLGAREDGLDFDKFVFGRHGYYFSVANLDAGQQGSATPPTVFVPTGPPLATGKPKYLGCAYSTAQAPNFGAYWNAVTPENGGKWGSVQPTNATTFNWGDLDAAYAQAKPATGAQSIFRMHTLIWGAQQPTWVKSLSSADQLAAIKAWMAAVAARYPSIDYIDVVNEPINTPPTGFTTISVPGTPAGTADPNGGGYINALGGTGTTGYDWIITSFQLARQYFPNARLMINEYSVENSATRAATYATIINLLKARNLLDGVGIQGHAFSTAGIPAATITANVATVAAPGVPLYVTEYDSDGPGDADQLAEYQRVFPLFWQNPSVQGVTLWGYRVGHWRTAQGRRLDVVAQPRHGRALGGVGVYQVGALGG
ncbi:MAG: endo-1,4-beta-xylanase, partial [Hymenobacter sp.]